MENTKKSENLNVTVKYSGFDTLKEALESHRVWALGEENGKRADFSDADLSNANLSGAIFENGLSWEQYLSEVVPALCIAGGKSLEEVAAVWNCHSWENCPMHIAFGVNSLKEIPEMHREEVEQFITFFDQKLIPNPIMTLGEK